MICSDCYANEGIHDVFISVTGQTKHKILCGECFNKWLKNKFGSASKLAGNLTRELKRNEKKTRKI